MAGHARIVYAPLNSEKDLSACCPTSCWQQLPSPLRAQELSPLLTFGLPSAIDGLRILLLGEGNGQEAFCLAAQAGSAGEVFAVTTQSEVLGQWRSWQSEYRSTHNFDNLSLLYTSRETLSLLPLAKASFDLVISLEHTPHSLLFDAPYLAGLLKSGGEWLRITRRPVLRRPAGFAGPFAMASRLSANSYQAARWFKLNAPASRPISPRVCYLGGLDECPDQLEFDQYFLAKGQFVEVPDAIYQVLIQSRYRDYLQSDLAPNTGGLFAK
jgi:hypothetical protein